MVQQTKDSAFTEHALAQAESGFSNSDEQPFASVAAKKSELQDLCNKSPIRSSQSVGSPFPIIDSGAKSPSPCHQGPPKTNAGSGHLVYVRRKLEIDLENNNNRDIRSTAVDHPLLKRSVHNETPQQHKEMNEPVISVTDVSPLQIASSPSLSLTIHPVSPSAPITEHVNPSEEDTIMMNVTLWQEQYHCLQRFLKMLDQSDQYEYIQMLQSLSPVELSRHVVELEKRSVELSLEEAKEMQRVWFINVYGKNVQAPSNHGDQLHK